MKYITIAGVSVNTESLPTQEELINSALQSNDYYRIPKQDALKDINLKIKESGLYKSVPKEPKENRKQKPHS